MKKLLILLLCLSLIATCFIGCDSDDKKLDEKEFSSSETSVETTSEETTTEFLNSETTSINTSNTTETTIESSDETTTEFLESETTGINTSNTTETTIESSEESDEHYESADHYSHDPMCFFYASSYEELESALLGKNEAKNRELKATFEEIPQAENFFNAIKEESDLVRPLINGAPMEFDSVCIVAEYTPQDPSIVYETKIDEVYMKVIIYYFDTCYDREISSFESLIELRQDMYPDEDREWEEKIMQIGGENISVLEQNTDRYVGYHGRSLLYYKDGVLVSLSTSHDDDKLLTDEFLQSFSVGYVAPTDNTEAPAENQN